MNIQHLIKMTNEIGQYFAAYPDRAQAEREVALHLTRFWDPRMRAQIVAHLRDNGGAGLSDIALVAIRQLAAAQNNSNTENSQ